MPSGDFKSDKVEMENVFITSLFWFRKGASRNLVGQKVPWDAFEFLVPGGQVYLVNKTLKLSFTSYKW